MTTLEKLDVISTALAIIIFIFLTFLYHLCIEKKEKDDS